MDYTVTIQEEAEKITHAVFHKSVEIVEGQYGHYIYKKDEMIYIPLLLSEGVPIQIVQQRAGHQDPKITLAVYSHVSKDKESLVADTLGEILFVWHENPQAGK